MNFFSNQFHTYSEEQQPLEEFFKAKNIRIKNEMVDDVSLSYPFPP
jgi:hypothetical protein